MSGERKNSPASSVVRVIGQSCTHARAPSRYACLPPFPPPLCLLYRVCTLVWITTEHKSLRSTASSSRCKRKRERRERHGETDIHDEQKRGTHSEGRERERVLLYHTTFGLPAGRQTVGEPWFLQQQQQVCLVDIHTSSDAGKCCRYPSQEGKPDDHYTAGHGILCMILTCM